MAEPSPVERPVLTVHERRLPAEPDSTGDTGETLDNIGSLVPTRVTPRRFLEARRDFIAARLAIGLLVMFGVTVVFPLVMWMVKGTAPPEMVSYVKDAVTIETTLLAAIIGFYFSQTRV
jgi:hypothetical protein